MRIFVDIDGTICETPNLDGKWVYGLSSPIQKHVDKINKLYDDGHEIHYWTARGTVSKKDYTTLTAQQLKDWGAKYHQLHVGNKPHFDMYICDKSWNSESFFHYKLGELP